MNNHNGPSVLVTGASTGIGEACARYLAARGWRVFAGVRQPADARRLEGAHIHPVTLNVTKPQHIQNSIEQITAAVGPTGLQGLVNNAGIAVVAPLEFLPLEELRRQFEVNFFGQVAVTQACLPLLRRGQGRVVNISSISGKVTAPLFGPYSTSKFALEAFSDALRRELAPWDIHVASIEPGAIKTPIWQKGVARADEMLAKLPAQAHEFYGPAMQRTLGFGRRSDERGIHPDAVAEAVHHALTARRPRTRYAMGLGARVVIFLLRFIPDRWMDWFLVRRLYG